MEILFELLAGLLQLLGELFLNLLFELLAECGGEALRHAFNPGKETHPIIASLGYALLGATFAGLSLLAINHSLVAHRWLRIANLFITPCVAGWLMVELGRQRLRRNQPTVMKFRFLYGYLFALAFALTRFYTTA